MESLRSDSHTSSPAQSLGSVGGAGWRVMAQNRAPSTKWLFTQEQLNNTPSRRCGIEAHRELRYRQQAANLIQDIGQRLSASQVTINTAIVYMHRFYMFRSFTKIRKYVLSQIALWIALKMEAQTTRLWKVVTMAYACMNPTAPPLDRTSRTYQQLECEVLDLECDVLETLNYELIVDHPDKDILNCCELVGASDTVALTSDFMATNSFHLTTFCLQHRPTVVACVCIRLACTLSGSVLMEGKQWWRCVDPKITRQLLDELTHEFLQILNSSKPEIMNDWMAIQAANKATVEASASHSSTSHQPLGEQFPQLAHSDSGNSAHHHNNMKRSRSQTGESEEKSSSKRPKPSHAASEDSAHHHNNMKRSRSQTGESEEKSSSKRSKPSHVASEDSAHHHNNMKRSRSQTGESEEKSSSKRPKPSHAASEDSAHHHNNMKRSRSQTGESEEKSSSKRPKPSHAASEDSAHHHNNMKRSHSQTGENEEKSSSKRPKPSHAASEDSAHYHHNMKRSHSQTGESEEKSSSKRPKPSHAASEDSAHYHHNMKRSHSQTGESEEKSSSKRPKPSHAPC